MTTERRWLKSVLTESASARVRMPWERGLRREATIARRKAAEADATAARVTREDIARRLTA